MDLAVTMIPDQLIERCKEGDAAGYEILYEKYSRAMYHTSLRIVNNTADAEDILQEAFIDAFRWLNTFQNRSSFGAWLKRIVVNKSINKIKREKLHFVDIDQTDVHSIVEEETENEQDIVFKVEEIKKAIKMLPAGYRTVLCLHLMEDYKHEEIAEILGISHNTVRSQYIRAKKKLLEIIKQGGRYER